MSQSILNSLGGSAGMAIGGGLGTDGSLLAGQQSQLMWGTQDSLYGQQNALWGQQNAVNNQSWFVNYEARYRELVTAMNWKCTNCKTDLQLAKKGKMNHLNAPGMVILECNHCGFEFMTRAMTDADRVDDQVHETGIILISQARAHIEKIRKKVKQFNLK